MLRLLTSEQTRQADRYTIANKPIASIDLMESASKAFVKVFIHRYPDTATSISIYCGTGNNGGDGLAIARLLKEEGYEKIKVFIARFSDKETEDFSNNLHRIKEAEMDIMELPPGEAIPENEAEIIIDALLGSGLNKPLEGDFKRLVEQVNKSGADVVSVDIPSGFPPEGIANCDSTFVQSDLTITFQRPKVSFLLPESDLAMKDFEVVEIGLDETFIQSANSPYFLLTKNDIIQRLKKRGRFSHKGTFGHALIIAGETKTMGAALLCAEACMNAGAGLITACIPESGLTALNTRSPEIMALLRNGTELPEIEPEKYRVIAIGPGIGASVGSFEILKKTLEVYKKPIVFDADALNILAENPSLLRSIPANSILTPHVKEFDRLFGNHNSWWERLETGMRKSKELDAAIILKNRYTIIFNPAGEIIFNPTGHPAMASGGSGDTLTGILASFLAQGYSSIDSAILAVYLHGKTGEDLAKKSRYVVPAGKIIENISETIGSFLA